MLHSYATVRVSPDARTKIWSIVSDPSIPKERRNTGNYEFYTDQALLRGVSVVITVLALVFTYSSLLDSGGVFSWWQVMIFGIWAVLYGINERISYMSVRAATRDARQQLANHQVTKAMQEIRADDD